MAIPATDQRCHNCKYVRLLHTDAPCYRCSHNAVSLWEPQPAPEPAKPTCGKCGGHPLVKLMPNGLCFECAAEASRLATLRARLAKLKPGEPIRWEADGNCALFRRLDGDEALVTPFGWTHDVKWEISHITILVPEGESHE